MRQTIQNANASLNLDGAAGYLTLPITPAPTGFNFALWIKTNKRTTASSTIYMSSTSAAFTDGFILSKGVGKGYIDFVAYNSTNNILSGNLWTGQVSDGSWVHIAVTYLPSGTCAIYQNGVLAMSTTATGTMATGTTSVYVGKRSYTAAYAGLNVSQLVWHNTTTPWTAAQVLALYKSGTIPTGATAVYPLSEGAGSIAYDTSGNGNNGTITSGTWSRDTPSKTRKPVNGNMVYNGDFEIAPVVNAAQLTSYRWLDGTVSPTSVVPVNKLFGIYFWDEAGQGSIMIDTSEKFRGKNSLKVSTLATGSYASAGLGDFNADDYISVLPSTSYTYSFWMKTNLVSGTADNGARIVFELKNGARSTTTSVASTTVKTTTDWTYYTGTINTASTTRFLTVLPVVDGDNGTATLIMDAWFADIQLYPTTPVTRSAATGRLTATGRSAA